MESFSDNAQWLRSDGAILGKVMKGPHAQGVLLTLPMPEGDDLEIAVTKMDAGTIAQFCELAREEYHERKASKASQRLRQKDSSGAGPRREESVPAPEEGVGVNLTDKAGVSERISFLRNRESDLLKEIGNCARECKLLEDILEVLNAQKDNDEKLSGVAGQGTRQDKSRVDTETRQA